MGIHDGHREKMRRRFLETGLEGFADHEALELLLYYAIPRRDTNPIAHALMERYDSLSGVLNAPVEDLEKVEGIGESAAILLSLVSRLSRKARIADASQETILNSSERAGAYLLERFAGERRELVFLLCLDRKGRLLACKRLAEGDVASADLNIRKVVEMALLTSASAVILAHNHPSGVAVPSSSDEAATRQVAEALRTIGVRLVDHIVVADRDFVSLAETAALLACWEDRTAMETRLLAQRAAVEASIQEALDRLRLLDTTIERLRKDEKQMNYDVTIKTLPERQVASVRQILPCYDREGDLWHIFVRETALLHIQDGDPALCISVYHDGEYKEADVDVEIQKTVKGTYPDTEHVKFKTIPPVTVASATFQGPYRQIGEVNQAVASWVEDNGYAFDGLFFNIYHVSPHETRNPEEFVTEVCYQVRKR